MRKVNLFIKAVNAIIQFNINIKIIYEKKYIRIDCKIYLIILKDRYIYKKKT